MAKKLSFILNRHQKIRLIILLIMIFAGSFVELLGVSAILPLVSAVTDPDIIHTNSRYAMLCALLGTDDIRTFILYTALILVVIYILKKLVAVQIY